MRDHPSVAVTSHWIRIDDWANTTRHNVCDVHRAGGSHWFVADIRCLSKMWASSHGGKAVLAFEGLQSLWVSDHKGAVVGFS
jgi:hypothetical protein